MKSALIASLGICVLSGLLPIDPPAATPTDSALSSVERFLGRVETSLDRFVARRRLTATTRGGKMQAWLEARTRLDASGFTYEITGQGGSSAIRTKVLVPALEAERKARRSAEAGRVALTPANYEFGAPEEQEGVVRIGVRPRRKEEMLIDGAIFLTPDALDLVRVEGMLVKSPSFWTRRVEVVRRYARLAGIRVPISMSSTAHVLVLGSSTFDMTIDYDEINGAPVAPLAQEGPARVDLDAAAEHHERGVAAHLTRCLDEASREYAKTMALDPPRPPSAAEWRLVERFAPRVFVTDREPFALKDAAAIVHPGARVIAYHLFWDDDIDFPDDNDPSDHEVVWVGYRGDAVDRVWTYFHGRVLESRSAATPPSIYVQWGKHGSMPEGWRTLPIAPLDTDAEAAYFPAGDTLTVEQYNRAAHAKLSTAGTMKAGHPLARQWPHHFTGSWDDFVRFTKSVDVLTKIRASRMALVSRWNSATINQQFLHYNFRPKLEWPAEICDSTVSKCE